MRGSILIGCAGWSLPKAYVQSTAEGLQIFGGDGTHLERYGRGFKCVEINSSFYRPHRPSTYKRWADSTPDDFRFAVKLPKQITHERRLANAAELLEAFLVETAGLGSKRGPILVQLPPSLAFEERLARSFFQTLRTQTGAMAVCEPRHASWFTPEADALLNEQQIARVAADPSLTGQAAIPGGWSEIAYFRRHGSPRTYWSEYDATALAAFAEQARDAAETAKSVWCIFDNTAAGAAVGNALQLAYAIGLASSRRPSVTPHDPSRPG